MCLVGSSSLDGISGPVTEQIYVSEFSYPAYLINLDRHPERQAGSIEQLQALSFNFNRIKGIEYQEMHPLTVRSVVDPTPTADQT